MITKLTRSPRIAARFIRQGEVVAFPTETVYGLGASIFDPGAIQKIFAAKGRPSDNPLIAHIADRSELPMLVREVTPVAARLADAFWPGPLTLVLPKQAAVTEAATAGLDTVGVRMPLHGLASAFIRECGVPLVAPSANLSGKPSPTTWQAVQTDLAGRISCILKGEQTEVGLESTVVDCTGQTPILLRAGAITLEQLQTVIPSTQLISTHSPLARRSPGLKYRHYSPQAAVIVVPSASAAPASDDSAFIGLRPPDHPFKLVQLCRDVEHYAHSLFDFFRRCDEAKVKTICCEAVPETGLGLALMDRLGRAAR